MTNPLAAIVNDISDCLEALENETSTQGSASDAIAERMRTVLPALLDGTEGTIPLEEMTYQYKVILFIHM